MPDGLLFLHAFPLDSTMWAPQLARFDRVAAVAPDFPGFGRASAGGSVMEMSVAADIGAAALDDRGVERAVVCGLSMGGYVALEFWRRHPGRVAGLVLANTRAGDDDEAGKARREALAQRLEAEGSAFLVESPPPLLSKGASEDLWKRVKEIIRAQPARAIAAASRGMAARPDFTPVLASISVPTLVITSTGDELIPREPTEAMGRQIPGATIEVIENAGHLSNLEAPDEFNRLLAALLKRCGIEPD